MANKKYFDLISKDEKAEAKKQLTYVAEEAAIQIQADILNARKAIAEANRRVCDAKSSKSFSSNTIVMAMNDLTDVEADLVALEAISTELF